MRDAIVIIVGTWIVCILLYCREQAWRLGTRKKKVRKYKYLKLERL